MSFVAVSLVETGFVAEVAAGDVAGSSGVAVDVVGSVGAVVPGCVGLRTILKEISSFQSSAKNAKSSLSIMPASKASFNV